MADDRGAVRSVLCALLTVPEAELSGLLAAHLTADSQWSVSHPINTLRGPVEVLEGLVLPLRQAVHEARRRDEIFIGGTNRRVAGGKWVASITHYVGNFKAPLIGISPSDRLVFLRSGEFYKIDGGKISEAKIIVDFVDLMRQAGRMPLPPILGAEMLFPGPATHDGVLPPDRARGSTSLDIVERMLGALHRFDPETFESAEQTGADGTWHEDMLWYGPAGIGSNYRWEGFVKDHRESFLSAFPDRKGGDHFCRIGDGDYAAISGWPSMTMTHLGDYLGVPATGKAMTLRVMDFYRTAEGRIMENWVCLDYLDLFAQMGVDLIARGQAMMDNTPKRA